MIRTDRSYLNSSIPSHDTAGGDDSRVPNRGDDSDTVVVPDALCAPGDTVALLGGSPAIPGFRNGGFEFVFGPPAPAGNFSNGVCTQPGNDTRGCVWNGLFLNSNGNVTFGVGDPDPTPTVPELRSGPPRIAPAWADLDPGTRTTSPGGPFFNTFPVQALGFANINAFRVRWINVPEFIDRDADPFNDSPACGSSNTFSVTLYDDGTGFDENTTESFGDVAVIGDNVDTGSVIFDRQEGPTDLRFVREPNTGVLVGCPPRPEGSGHFIFEYCRMDLLGTADRPVIVGFSIGGTSPFIPPGLCEINLSTAAAAADNAPFGVIQGVTASLMPCLIGEGTEPHLFELFNEGSDTVIGPSGAVTIGTPDFDLRGEGNVAALCTPARQRDLNRGKVGFFGVGCAPPANPICQTVVPGGIRNDSDYYRIDQCVVRSAGEHGRDAGSSPTRRRSSARASSPTRACLCSERQDRINGSHAGLRHERRRHHRCDDRLRVGDASKQEPSQGDVQPAGGVPGHGLPDGVLRRGGDADGDDDVHGRRQQHIRAVHEDDRMPDQPWSEGAGGVLSDPE